jgi:hypothetical protein
MIRPMDGAGDGARLDGLPGGGSALRLCRGFNVGFDDAEITNSDQLWHEY